jgi:integrase
MSIGGYPSLGLAEARLRADKLRRELAEGVDPILAQRNRKAEARSKSKTFGMLAERYVLEHTRRHNRPRTAEENERNLRVHVLPHWAERNYDTITRADIVALIERIARKAPIAANRVASLISRVFTFAIDVGLLSSSPAIRLRKPGKEQVRTRVLSDAEIRVFWTGIIKSPVSKPVGLALRVALLLGLRGGEIAGLRRDELRDLADPKRAALELAGERTKNGRPLWLPLSPFARDTITEALELSNDDVCVFPSIEGASIDPHCLGVAMRRFAEQAGWHKDAPTPHDLRRTLRTRLSSLGISAEICDQILNHSPADVGRRHYDRHKYENEKRAALNEWSRLLHAIVEGRSANVVALRRRKMPATA